MFEAAGLPSAWIGGLPNKAAPRTNVTPGPLTVEVFRQIRLMSGKRRIPRSAAIRKTVLQRASARGWNAVKFQGLDAEMAGEVASRFGKGNDRVASQFWDRGWSEVFGGAEPLPPRNEFEPAEVSSDVRRELDEMAGSVLSDMVPQTGWRSFRPSVRRGAVRG